MADQPSRKVILAAIVANAAIVVAKLTAAAISGSSAMLSEGIHSIVDTGNGALLWLGMRLAARPADPVHPFGHGKDLYFWSFVVAMQIFGVGGGVSIWEGVEHIRSPRSVESLTLSLAVLGAVALFEGVSLVIALREFGRYRREKLRDLPFFRAVRMAKDPTTFSVVLEDTAAIAGVAVAATGIVLAHALDLPVLDGVASCVIGAILCVVAFLLGKESRGLLIGERALPWIVEEVRRVATTDPAVESVVSAQTMHMGPDAVLLTLTLRFRRGVDGESTLLSAERIAADIKARFADIKHVFLDVDCIASG